MYTITEILQRILQIGRALKRGKKMKKIQSTCNFCAIDCNLDFYVEDGRIVKAYNNDSSRYLDYQLENKIYLNDVPTTLDQLMDIADAGEIMPPKSTWFEPKLRDGLLVHTLD